MDATTHRCPSCSATLPFNPDTQSWKCEYCGADYTLEDLEKFEKAYSKARTSMEVDEYSCPSCGAKIVTDENTAATFCVYCGSTAIIKSRLSDFLKPDYIIPFETTKEQAVDAFIKAKKGKLFAPRAFGNKNQIEKITGVYIPFWRYSVSTSGRISGKAETVTTWRAGDYRYTKRDTYRVRRDGEMKFFAVPVDGSKKFDDDIMDSIEPFMYEDVKDFSPSYLSGFLAEKYDVTSNEAYERAFTRIKNSFSDVLKNDITGYSTVSIEEVNVNIKDGKEDYILLPVWMLNIKYNEKMHMFAMNGQTGKMIGNIPVSWKKLLLWFAGVFACTFGLLSLLFIVA